MSKLMQITFAHELDYDLVLERINDMVEEEEFIDGLDIQDVTNGEKYRESICKR